MPNVSVIIPVYNVEQYLRECLDSVVNQTLKDIEIICVNDGSTDGSLEILREYEKKDKRIIVIDKENTGAGDSRNKGLEIAKGEYITFFDSDDYYSNIEALKVMHQNIIQNNADITICRSSRFKQKSKLVKEQKWSIKKELFECKNIFNPKDYSKYIFQAFIGWPWDKLYKREFILRNKLNYQKLRHSNDTFFVLFSLCLAEKISITEDNLVMHRMHKTSVAATREKRPECFYKALTQLKEQMLKRGIFNIYKQSYINCILSFSDWHISTVKNNEAEKIMISCFKKLWEENEISKLSKDYFYDMKLYKKMKNLVKPSPTKLLKKIFSLTNEK